MNTHDIDIELPQLHRPQVPLIDADIDLMDIRRLADWCEKTAKEYARAAVEADRQRLKLELEKWYEEAAVEYQKTGDPYFDGKEDAFDLAIQIVDGRKK